MQEQAGETVRHFASQGPDGLTLATLIVIVAIFAAVGVYVARMFGSRLDALTAAIRAEIDRAHGATAEDRAEHAKSHAMILSEIGELRKDGEEDRRAADKAATRTDELMANLIVAVRVALAERPLATPHGGIPRPAELTASVG